VQSEKAHIAGFALFLLLWTAALVGFVLRTSGGQSLGQDRELKPVPATILASKSWQQDVELFWTVEFSYVVDGEEYVSTKPAVSPVKNYSHRRVTALVRQCTPGARVEAHYDPADPSFAVLLPEASASWHLLVIGAGVMTALGWLALLGAIWGRLRGGA
jgi:hypothetical protein